MQIVEHAAAGAGSANRYCLQGAFLISPATLMLQDAEYADAGAQLGNGSALQQDIVLKVRPPHTEEVPQLRAGAR
jgi:hypothetical protein